MNDEVCLMEPTCPQQNKKAIYFILASLPLICFLVSYWGVFPKLFIQWAKTDNGYCYLVLPLFFYFCWEKRHSFQFSDFSWSLWGVFFNMLALLLTFIGEVSSIVTLQFMGIWFCIFSLAVMLYGWRVRFLGFPFLILLFIIPLPPFLNNILTFKLKMLASKLSSELLRFVGITVLLEGNVLDFGVEKLQVIDACSGLRSLVAMTVMAIIIGHLYLKGWWRKAVLLFFVVPLTISLNTIRIFSTGILTVHGYHKLAEGLFHDIAGLVVSIIAGGILLVLSIVLMRIGSIPVKNMKKENGGHRSGRLMVASIVAAQCLLFVSCTWALEKIPTESFSLQRKRFDTFPMQIGDWQGRRIYLNKKVARAVGSDDYISAVYSKSGSPNVIYLSIPFYLYQKPYHSAHAPQTCLLGSGWSILQSRERSIAVSKEKKVNIMTMDLRKGQQKILATFFFFQRGRVYTSPWASKLYLMWDAFTRRRTDGALVRVEMVLAPNQPAAEALEIINKFTMFLWKVLPEYVPL